jgi:hypothetical protein
MRCGEVDHESMGGKLECAVLCEGSYRPRLDLGSAGYRSRSCMCCEWDVRPRGSQHCWARLVCKRGQRSCL